MSGSLLLIVLLILGASFAQAPDGRRAYKELEEGLSKAASAASQRTRETLAKIQSDYRIKAVELVRGVDPSETVASDAFGWARSPRWPSAPTDRAVRRPLPDRKVDPMKAFEARTLALGAVPAWGWATR